MEKKMLLILLLVLCFPISIFAETIVLKSGQKVEGQIIKRTDEYVKIDFQEVILTYFLDEIETIDGKKVNLSIKQTNVVLEDKRAQYPYISEKNEIASIKDDLSETASEQKVYTLEKPPAIPISNDKETKRQQVSDFVRKTHSVMSSKSVVLNEKQNLFHQAEVSGDREKMNVLAAEIRDIISQAKEEVAALSAPSDCKELYTLNLEWFQAQVDLFNAVANQNVKEAIQIHQRLLEITKKHSQELNRLIQEFVN